MRLGLLGLLVAVCFLPLSAAAEDTAPPYAIERSAVHTLQSEGTDRRYNLNVKLPPGYADPANRDRRYPVLYMTDGDYTFQVTSGISKLLFSQKVMEEFILVGIGNEVGVVDASSRNRDLTPWPHPKRPGHGEAAAYLDFIRDQAMPMVEAAYRIDPARRTLVGQSYGGLFGLWVLFTQPELFESYILTSPSIWYAEPALTNLAQGLAKRPDLNARVYMATGGYETQNPASDDPRWYKTMDMVGDSREMADRLAALKLPGLTLRNDVVEGAVHVTTFPVGLVHALHWLFPYLGE